MIMSDSEFVTIIQMLIAFGNFLIDLITLMIVLIKLTKKK
jgi:hypothetical protein